MTTQPDTPATAHPALVDAGTDAGPAPLRLGFVRGVAPTKWANRWAEAVPGIPLELVPFPVRTESAAKVRVDLRLERVAPGATPSGVRYGEAGAAAEPGGRFGVRLYTEAVALVVEKSHELSEAPAIGRAELDLVTLLAHPEHPVDWPTPASWTDPSWAPSDAAAALELVATGMGSVLLALPLARHLADKKRLAVIPVLPEAGLPGTEIWAVWDVARDAGDVQQLVGIMRGRTARSERPGAAPETATAVPVNSPRKSASKAASAPGGRSTKQASAKALPKNSRGAQLAAAQAKREAAKRAKAAEKQSARKRKRR